MNTRKHRKNDEGFTLIELMIVMSIMLILMVMAVPQAIKMLKAANQTSAVQSLRAINGAEVQYNSTYPANGFACSLTALGGAPGTAPSAAAAQLLNPELAVGNKSGYKFSVDKCTKVTINNVDQFTGYQLNAIPNTPGKSGDLGYCTDESGLIKIDRAGGTNCTESLQ